MGLLDEFLRDVGAVWDRVHIFTFLKDSEDGVFPRFTRDLRPVPETGLTGGHLLELYTVFDRRHTLDANSRLRFDVLEEDWLFTGGLDDRMISLLGTGAVAPQAGAPTRQLATQVHDLPAGRDAAWFVEEYKRTLGAYEDTILVLRENPTDAKPGERRTHVIAWYRLQHQEEDIGELSELYFVVDLDERIHAASPVVEIAAAPPGVSVRLTGSVTDLEPLVAAQAEPLEDIPVTLGGRRAVSSELGEFVLDARLPVGNHPLRFSRPGIDPLERTAEVTAAADGKVTVALLDPDGNEMIRRTTAQAATEASVLTFAIPIVVKLRVHKLRGTVLWPDSRPGDVPANYHGSPLADRRVYVLPLPAPDPANPRPLTDHRPKTTKRWERLKDSPDVLRSARPGKPRERERTDLTGRFEVKYVDFTDGNRFLIWVERLAPGDAPNTTVEETDHVVRTLQRRLIQLHRANLALHGNAGMLINQPGPAGLNRNLVDHEFNLTRDVVEWGVDALRVAQFPAPDGLTLVRPQRTTREQFDAAGALAPATGENRAIPPNRIVDGLRLQVLPLVPLHEHEDEQGSAVRRARRELVSAAEAAFPTGYDSAGVPLALDVSRLGDSVDLRAAAAPPWVLAADEDARKVELLERTLIVRPLLRRGGGGLLPVDAARWHSDAVSLADGAFVAIPRVANPLATNRKLNAAIGTAPRHEPKHLPVLGAVAPMLPGLAARRIYLAPGHGLYPANANRASNNPGDWESPRGGYFANAGEDEVDAFMSSEIWRIAKQNDAVVYAPRELENFTAAGVANTAAGVFAPQVAADFPRLWQQNPIYYLGATRNRIVTGNPVWRAPVAPSKNGQGIDARVAHVRALAAASEIDLVLATHTNASGLAVPARGSIVEYLNVSPAVRAAGDANPLGRALSDRTIARILERTHLDRYGGGVRTMDRLNSESVADLTGTSDHSVLDDGNVDPVCQDRVLGAVPALPVPGGHSPAEQACFARLPNPRTPGGPIVPPLPAGHAAGTQWDHRPFPTPGWPNGIPVALAEVAFHDSPDDAALLSRAWFRRLAAEAMAIAIEEQLRDSTAVLNREQVQKVLRRVFGDTPAVHSLYVRVPPFPPPPPPVATPAWIQGALRDVASDPGAPVASTLDAVSAAALVAATGFTRAELVNVVRDRLKVVAGWDGDPPARIDTFVERPIRGAALDRPNDPATRAEAGALVCNAVGLAPASIARAETAPFGNAREPLVHPAAVAAGRTVYFSEAEANLLAARLVALHPSEIYHVADAWFADTAWAPLDAPRGSRSFELDAGTVLVVVVQTAGVAWKTDEQGDPDELEDIEIRVDASGSDRTLACTFRDGRLAVSEAWALDLPVTAQPLDVTVELRVDHRIEGWLSVGTKRLRLKVRPIPAA
jgi:hypothetical protein